MNLHSRESNIRWKAVWGAKRPLTALAIFVLGLAPSALAARHADSSQRTRSRHHQTTPKAKPGEPSLRVKYDRFDDALTRDIRNHGYGDTVDVIACLQPGQDLPARYKRFSRLGKFTIIDCYALDSLPVDALEGLGKLRELHHARENRPSFSQDLLSSTAVQADVLARPVRLHRRGRHGGIHRFRFHSIRSS